jgi:regulator of sirC expression with transglutaminase-like and TPR domain
VIRAAIRIAAILLAFSVNDFQRVEAAPRPAPAYAIRETLQQPESKLDYLQATIAFEKLIDSANDATITEAMVARLVDAARQMAGPNPTDTYKLAAIRKAIYDSGPWNYNRAFSYDLADPFGQKLGNRQLSTYIRTRKGNCVSMPTLFLIVADRMGLNVQLATAPLHMFVRYTDKAGAVSNLEATSGGHAARDAWYREKMPMTDRAIESGAYMRTLTKRETVAELATTVMDALIDQSRFQEAVDVADAILAVNPRESYVMAKKGTALAGMMQAEFVDKYPNPQLIPPNLRLRYRQLAEMNEAAFKAAEALGWEPTT